MTEPFAKQDVGARPVKKVTKAKTGAKGPRLGNRVYEEIIHVILDTELTVGDRLPTEVQFCALFGVSRTVVREALSRLKIDGIIDSRQGQGSFVLRQPNRDVFEFASVGSVAELQTFFEYRQVIEGETSALAALRRTSEDLSRIAEACQAIDVAFARKENAVEEDLDFHFAIASAARNKFLYASLKATRGEFLKGMRFARELTTRYSEERGKRLQAEHRAVLDAIRAFDPDAARAAMKEHLSRTRDRVFKGDSR